MALYIGGVAVDATAAEIDVLDGLDRGSIIYGNASSATTVLGQGNADEVLTSDGTDIAWAAAGGGGISHDGSTADGVLTYKDADEATVEANLTFDGTDLAIAGTGKIYLDGGSSTFLCESEDGYLDIEAQYFVHMHINGHNQNYFTFYSGGFRPGSSDNKDLGYSTRLWDDFYQSGSHVTSSDERRKENIADSSLGLSFLNQLRPVQYKLKDYTVPEVLYKESDNIPEDKEVGDVWIEEREMVYSRTHYGLIAQEVEQVLEDNEISTNDFAPFIKSPILDGDTEGEPTGDHFYGLGYIEFISILIKAVKELSSKVEALENA